MRFVFQIESARLGKSAQLGARVLRQGLRYAIESATVGMLTVDPVRSGTRHAERADMRLKVRDGAPADQRQPPAKPPGQVAQRLAETIGDVNSARRSGDPDQRPVKIQEQGDRSVSGQVIETRRWR